LQAAQAPDSHDGWIGFAQVHARAIVVATGVAEMSLVNMMISL
jgi:hypothetical protein